MGIMKSANGFIFFCIYCLFLLGIIFAETNYTTEVILKTIPERMIGYPDPENRRILEQWNFSTRANPDSMGTYYGGDILFIQKPNSSRSFIPGWTTTWPDRIVPYEIEGGFTREEQNRILTAMNTYERYTCLRFQPRTRRSVYYIRIVSNLDGCFSMVGMMDRRNQPQVVSLQSYYCTTMGTIIHELAHAVGLLHEHQRPNRDDYVRVIYENVVPAYRNQFTKDQGATSFGYRYDYGSIMHYSPDAFSSNRKYTMIPYDESAIRYMGQRDTFAHGDIDQINIIYKCRQQYSSKSQRQSKHAHSSATRFVIHGICWIVELTQIARGLFKAV